MTELAELVADCGAHGIRLLATGDGGLTIDAPQGALMPDLIRRLKAHKGELLELLRPTLPGAPAVPTVDTPSAAPILDFNTRGESERQQRAGPRPIRGLDSTT